MIVPLPPVQICSSGLNLEWDSLQVSVFKTGTLKDESVLVPAPKVLKFRIFFKTLLVVRPHPATVRFWKLLTSLVGRHTKMSLIQKPNILEIITYLSLLIQRKKSAENVQLTDDVGWKILGESFSLTIAISQPDEQLAIENSSWTIVWATSIFCMLGKQVLAFSSSASSKQSGSVPILCSPTTTDLKRYL